MPFFPGMMNVANTINNRFRVGGAGTWDNSTTTQWSYVSGGPGGAPVPTASNNVYFNAATGGGTTTRTATTSNCKNLDFTGFTGTFAGSGALAISGSWTSSATMTLTYSGARTFNATSGVNTITSAGKTFLGSNTFNGVGGTWLLLDAYVLTNAATTVTNGTLDTNGQSLNVNTLNKGAAGNLILGSSAITTVSLVATAGAGTINAGTSTITVTGASFTGGGYTYNVVNLTTGAVSVTGINTFDGNFVSTASTLSFANDQTFNAGMSLSGTSQASRSLITTSATNLAPVTLTCNGSAPILSNLDILGIIAAGTAGTWAGTSLGDCQGNSGITFTAPVTGYFVGGGTVRTYYSNFWSSSSGGSVGAPVPLPQDTIVFDANSFTAGGGLSVAGARLPTLDFTNATNNPSFSTGAGLTPSIYGDLVLKSGMTTGGSPTLIFQGSGITQSLDSAGISFTIVLNINIRNSGTFSITSPLTSTTQITWVQGNYDQGNNNATFTTFLADAANARTFSKNADLILTSSSLPLRIQSTSLVTTNDSGGTIKFTNTSATAKTVVFGGKTYNNVWFANGGAGSSIVINESGTLTNTFNDFKIDPLLTINFQSSTTTTQFSTFTANGSSGNLITLTGQSNNLVSLSGTPVVCTFMALAQSKASGATFTATSSVDNGSNTGWVITP